MKTISRFYPLLLLAFLFLSFHPEAAQAQSVARPGIRIGDYSDAGDVFLGGEILVPLGRSWNINPNIEYVFSQHMTYATFNFDFSYDVPSKVRNVIFWAGGGPAFVYTNVEGPSSGNTNLGLDLLGGIGFNAGSVTPYIQPKMIIKNNSEFVLGFGVRF